MREIFMREIKFKILKIDLHSFLYDEGRTILEIGIEDLGAIRNNPKNYLFIQYTGLKDKNGKEIYEEDMVKALILDTKEDFRGSVYWEDGGFYFGSYGEGIEYWELSDIEIIGNIYENPELSKDKK